MKFGKDTYKIGEFRGEYRFLSNFWTAPLKVWGMEFPTSEHAYQASKSLDKNHWDKIRNCKTPGQTKRLGKKCKVRPDWDDVKIDMMYDVVYAKFSQNEDLKQKLLDTKGAYLEEGNTWGDVFWGVCDGKGENHLGKILMKVRSELNER